MNKRLNPGLITLMILLWSSAAAPQTVHTVWVQGYAKTVRGGDFQYHSPHPGVASSLLIRSQDSAESIEWESAPVPEGKRENDLAFIWIFGIDANRERHVFDLHVNGEQWLSFSNPPDTLEKRISVDGKNRSRLTFLTTLVDRYDDMMGYAILHVPASALPPGKPVRFKITGESAGSPVWVMTFKGRIEPGMTLTPMPALMHRGNRLVQPLVADIVHLGDPVPFRIESEGSEECTGTLQAGNNRISLFIPEAVKEKKVRVRVLSGKKVLHSARILLLPVRKWTVYLVQHTHTDIGYTRPQSTILPEHIRFIDTALDLCDCTDAYPDDAKFRWTCETSWAVREYLTSRPEEEVRRLQKRVEEGRIELTGLFLNMSELMDEPMGAASLWPVRLFREKGFPVYTAMQNDINGIGWCMADYLSGLGVEYLIMGENATRALVPFDKPTLFWWESPSGKRVLAYRPDHYHTGNTWQIHTGDLGDFGKGLLNYLKGLEARQYPFDRVSVQYAGYITDNSPPSCISSELIKTWNEHYAWPRLRNATAHEFPEYIKKHHNGALAVHRAAWPDWWSDGFGSAARETAAARKAHAGIHAIEGAMAMLAFLGEGIPEWFRDRMDRIQDALLFYDEHTFGAAESISDPLSENSMVQWGQKSGYVWEAVGQEGILAEMILGQLRPFLPEADGPSIVVLNTLNWARSGYHEVTIDHAILPADRAFRIVGPDGNPVPVRHVSSRTDVSTWGMWVKDVPAMGYASYRIELLDGERREAGNVTGNVLENAFYRIEVDTGSGAVSRILDKTLNTEIVDPECPWKMGQFIYETLSNRQQLERLTLDSFQRESLKNVRTKPGAAGPVWRSVVISGEYGDTQDQSGVHCEIRLFDEEKRIEFAFAVRQKGRSTPEAFYVAFPFLCRDGLLDFEAQGGRVMPGLNQLEGTSSDWNAVQNFIAIKNAKTQIVMSSDEILLAQLGGIHLGKFQYRAHVEKPHVYSWVLNNYWTTNFKASQEGEFRWRYAVTSAADTSGIFSARFGWGHRVPFLSRILPAGRPSGLPSSLSLLEIGFKDVLLVHASPARYGRGVILQLRECGGKKEEGSVTVYGMNHPAILTEVNAVGERIGAPSECVAMEPYESKFLLMEWASGTEGTKK